MQTLFADDEKNQSMVTIKQELPDDYEEEELLTSQDDESIATTESEVDDGHFEVNKVKSPVYKRRKVCSSVCGCWWLWPFYNVLLRCSGPLLCPCCFDFHLVEFALEHDWRAFAGRLFIGHVARESCLHFCCNTCIFQWSPSLPFHLTDKRGE